MLSRSLAWFTLLAFSIPVVHAEDKPQYEFGEIKIPQASAAEPLRSQVSIEHAPRYLDQGAAAWNGAEVRQLSHQRHLYDGSAGPHAAACAARGDAGPFCRSARRTGEG